MKIRTDEVVSRTTHEPWEFFYTGREDSVLRTGEISISGTASSNGDYSILSVEQDG